MQEWNSSMCLVHQAICLQVMCTLSYALGWNRWPLDHLRGGLRVQTGRDKGMCLDCHWICQPGMFKTRPSGWGLFNPLYSALDHGARNVPTCSTQPLEEMTNKQQTLERDFCIGTYCTNPSVFTLKKVLYKNHFCLNGFIKNLPK